MAHLEEKLASLPKPQERSITQKRLATLWQHKLNRTRRMLLALRDGKDARFWVDYELAFDLLVEELLKKESSRPAKEKHGS